MHNNAKYAFPQVFLYEATLGRMGSDGNEEELKGLIWGVG